MKYMKQLLEGVQYLHKRKIVHRNICSENIVLDENGGLRIIGFGSATRFDPNKKLNQKIGNIYYVAPEVLERQYDEKCDIWSLGIVLFIMLVGNPPFQADTIQQLENKIKEGGCQQNRFKTVSESARYLLTNMLEYDTDRRFSAEQCLTVDWFYQQ